MKPPSGIESDTAPADLEHLQTWLYRLIVAPDGVDQGLAAESPGAIEAIKGEGRLSARDRLEIYANAYFYRLRDVLKEEFPATLAVVGELQFHNLVTGYLVDYPPRQPSILEAGRSFADFIRTHPFGDRWPYLADLAQLERATLDVFHAASASKLDAATMRRLPPPEWPALILKTRPASRLLDLHWQVDALLRAIETGEPRPDPLPIATSVLVWRNASRTYYRALDLVERSALGLVQNGAAFAEICEAIAAQAPPDEDVPALINRLLARWLSEGVLAEADSPSSVPEDVAS